MALTVQKHAVEPGYTTLQLPWGANPIGLDFTAAGDAIAYVVADSDDARATYTRHFCMVATGEAIALPLGMGIQRHVASAAHPEGIVFHLFEVVG